MTESFSSDQDKYGAAQLLIQAFKYVSDNWLKLIMWSFLFFIHVAYLIAYLNSFWLFLAIEGPIILFAIIYGIRKMRSRHS